MTTAPEDIVFCARCAAPMLTREHGGKPRRCCSRCDHVHFVEPRVGVGAFIVEAGRILLVQRGVPPARGEWAVPAGYLDRGVDPREQVAVEVREETGLEVEVGALVDAFFNPPQQGGAGIFLLYAARVTGGRLQAGDDADAARFFSAGELPEVAFESTRAAIRLFARTGDAGTTEEP